MSSALVKLIGERPGHVGITGVVIGVVTNNNDAEGFGRVKVRFPWLSAADESFWARVATFMAGNNRGAYFLPEVDDEVLVVFEHGDVRFPYVIGSLWNGKDKAPAGNSTNDVRLIKSRSGHTIRLNDTQGKETVEIVDASGKNSIVIDTAGNTITITAGKDVVLAAPQGTIRLTAQQIEIESATAAKIEAGSGMEVKAAATLNVKGAIVNIN